MKIRIIREAVDLDVLVEAKEDDIVAKYEQPAGLGKQTQQAN